MQDLQVIYPFQSVGSSYECYEVINDLLCSMPLFEKYANYTEQEVEPNTSMFTFKSSPNIVSGNNVDLYIPYTTYSSTDIFIRVSDYLYTDNIARFNKADSSIRYSPSDSYDINYNNLRNFYMYMTQSTSTNGFWMNVSNGIDTYVFKTFVTRCIDEDARTFYDSPLFAKHYTYGDVNNICWIYIPDTTGYVKSDIKNLEVAKPGYSNAYIIRQLRIDKFLYPDIFVISGGLNRSNKDIITIEHITYAHLCNDLYIKIK